MTTTSHTAHWGIFDAVVEAGEIVAAKPYPADRDPSPLLGNFPGSVRHRARVTAPAIRRGWLENGPGSSDRRGREEFVEVGWDQALDLLASELKRVLEAGGPESIYGGSYGWASAGRFHHAQSQIHRFLNLLGGYVSSVHSYSMGAGEPILDRTMGSMSDLNRRAPSWDGIIAECNCFVSFGGVPIKNTNVNTGGVSRHTTREHLIAAAAAGVEFVHISPLRDDTIAEIGAQWLPIRPGADVAMMLGLAYVLETEQLIDRAVIDRYATGYERFRAYLLGEPDGQPKTPEWAAALCEIPADTIRELARKMARGRTLINVGWSLQRSEHGEQVPWMGLTLAAMLGQLGLPGGGYGFGYGSIANMGNRPSSVGFPVFQQGHNHVKAFIPVARIADMLLNPGDPFDFNGQHLTYPDIDLIYWAGGNPFHHHQDLGRFRRALAKPSTIVVHEPYWTGMARHADIVMPSTITLERNDIGGTPGDPVMVAMHQAVQPYADSRTDYAIFSGLAERLGVVERFTEGRDEAQWLRAMYERWQGNAGQLGVTVPDFDSFWSEGEIIIPSTPSDETPFTNFRADPEQHPLRTPSGKVEIFSETIDSFGYDDCAGHPTWYEPREWLGSADTARHPLHLIANNPRTRLHSQLDLGPYSQSSKIQGREPARLNPADAAARGISSGDIVRLFNKRGSCLAGAIVTDDVRPGVVQLSTGAWFDPLDPEADVPFCVHGNPNVLTADRGTSKFAQGSTGQHALIEIERWDGEVPPIRASDPPVTVTITA